MSTGKIKKIVPVILSGGAGTRLWPLSRERYPKQFLDLSGSGKTLVQETALRLKDDRRFTSPLVICNIEQRFIVAEQLRECGISDAVIILEPEGRNTAPALSIAALYAEQNYGNSPLLALPSDHIIDSCKDFAQSVIAAKEISDEGYIVTFGIAPAAPETAYGYIKTGAALDSKNSIYKISHFAEKPGEKKAKEYYKNSAYLWNSGIFLCSSRAYLAEIKKLAPEIKKHCEAALAYGKVGLDFIRLEEEAFKSCSSISIDNAIMEKTAKGSVMKTSWQWNDIGNWQALWDIATKDEDGNSITGEAYLLNSRNSYIRSEGAAISAAGIDNLIIVSTKDVVLVASKSSAQEIKNLVTQIKNKNHSLVRQPRKVYRPWGYYEAIDGGSGYQVKRINVKPGGKLSLQKHNHRAEHWIVVKGTAKILLEGKEHILAENESIYIPKNAKHQIENPGTIDLNVIEVQSGSYLGEDDIVRFADKYGRG